MFRVILKSATCVAALSCFSIPASAVEVYLFKGAGDFSFVNENMHFSRGLNEISDTLNKEGIRSEVRRFGAVEQALGVIRKRKPKTIALVGHSMGALASMAMARNLKGEGVEIVYMALLDIPGPVGVAGENVNWVENYYTINPVYGKLTNVNSHPNAKNIHVSGYIHNRLDDAPKVQNGILAAIRQIHASEQGLLKPEQPETIHVQTNPQPVEIDNQVTASVQAPAASSYVEPVYVAPTPTPIVNQANVSAPLVQRPVQPLATAEPYKLPSVQTQASANETVFIAPPEPIQQQIDPVTTASVHRPSVLERGKNLLRRAGGFLRRNGTQNSGFKGQMDSDR